MEITVPAQVAEIISVLNEHTYKAYLVGECVRGLIKGENPLDFDIVTDAEMNRLLAIFEDRYKTNTDYVDKGELIIINGAMGISVSPYRCRIAEDGKPIYCTDVNEDLKRRAFKANAVAYSLDEGIYDPFGGYDQLCGDEIMLSAIVAEPLEEKKQVKGKKGLYLHQRLLMCLKSIRQLRLRLYEDIRLRVLRFLPKLCRISAKTLSRFSNAVKKNFITLSKALF